MSMFVRMADPICVRIAHLCVSGKHRRMGNRVAFLRAAGLAWCRCSRCNDSHQSSPDTQEVLMGTISLAQVDPRVVSFLEKPRKMLINGNWVEAVSGKTFPTYDPSTGEVLAQVAEGDKADI